MRYLPRKTKKLVRSRALARRIGVPLRTTAHSQYKSENVAQYLADVRNLRRQNTVGTNGYYKPPYGNAFSLNEARGKERLTHGGERAGYRDYLVTSEVRPITQAQKKFRSESIDLREELLAVEKRIKQLKAEGRLKRFRNRDLIRRGEGRIAELRNDVLFYSKSVGDSSNDLMRAHVRKLNAIKNAKKPKLPQ